jgi:hypothetical protein
MTRGSPARPAGGASTAPVPTASDQTRCLKPGLRMSLRDRRDSHPEPLATNDSLAFSLERFVTARSAR